MIAWLQGEILEKKSPHLVVAANGVGGSLTGTAVTTNFYGSTPGGGALAPQAMTATGGSQPHNNMAPFLGLNFIISLFGIFPSQG